MTRWLIVCTLITIVWHGPARGAAAVSSGEDMMIKEEKGLRFKVPADWPIEERDGAVGPVPIDEYMSRKFAVVMSRLEAIEQRLAESERSLKILGDQVERQRKTLQSLHDTSGGPLGALDRGAGTDEAAVRSR